MHYYYHPESDNVFKMQEPLPPLAIERGDLSILTYDEYIEVSIKLDINHEDTLL